MFQIEYEISDNEWRSSASKRWDTEAEPIGDLFEGNIRILVSGENLFGSKTYLLSVSNLAVGLSHLCSRLGKGHDAQARFHQLDGCLEISFNANGDSVEVSHNGSPNRQWTTSRAAIINGIYAFLCQFRNDLIAKVPEPFEWKELHHLKSSPT